MTLLFAPDAFNDIPPHDTDRVMRKINWLWANRGSVTHFPLGENLSGFLKRRLGDYRIIYTYDRDSDDMTIHLVGRREDIYKRAAEHI